MRVVEQLSAGNDGLRAGVSFSGSQDMPASKEPLLVSLYLYEDFCRLLNWNQFKV